MAKLKIENKYLDAYKRLQDGLRILHKTSPAIYTAALKDLNTLYEGATQKGGKS